MMSVSIARRLPVGGLARFWMLLLPLLFGTSCQGPSSSGKPYFAVKIYYQVLASAPILSSANGSGSHSAGSGKRWIVFCINKVEVNGTGDGDNYNYKFDPKELYLTSPDELVFEGATAWTADADFFSIAVQPAVVKNLKRVLARVDVTGLSQNAAQNVTPHLLYHSKENADYVESVLLIQQPPFVTAIENITSGNIMTPNNMPSCEHY